jgi:hypothetical protein
MRGHMWLLAVLALAGACRTHPSYGTPKPERPPPDAPPQLRDTTTKQR